MQYHDMKEQTLDEARNELKVIENIIERIINLNISILYCTVN